MKALPDPIFCRKRMQRSQRSDEKAFSINPFPSLFSLRSFTAKKTGNQHGFTLFEMMVTLAVFVLLAAAVFGLMTGVIQSSSTLQDNQNRRDEIAALNAYMKKKLTQLPANTSLISYQRGDGEGLLQNGIVFGTINDAMVFDAKVQPNGYYTIRMATFITSTDPSQSQDARQTLQQLASTDDPSVVWTNLMSDIKTLDWKFLDFNATIWVDLWPNNAKPNLVEFSMQPAGELQPTTMDFWVPKIDTVTVAGVRAGP